MIIVTGSVTARPETFEEARSLCRAHVARSRREDGCDHHAVHQADDNPLRLVFVERWRDRAALARHFADPDARGFVASVRPLAAGPTTLEIYEARELSMKDLVELVG